MLVKKILTVKVERGDKFLFGIILNILNLLYLDKNVFI